LVHPSDITGLPFLSFQEDTPRPSWTLTGPDEAATVVAFDPILWTSEFSFVRFSRPRPRLVFAANPVVATHNGKPTLMVRVGNGHAAVLTDGAAKLNVFLLDTTAEGRSFRRAQELQLERAHIPIFTICWTLMHVLDEQSPFARLR
jgi:inward rectifier potassium channel